MFVLSLCISFAVYAQDAPKSAGTPAPAAPTAASTTTVPAAKTASNEPSLEPLTEDVLKGMETYWTEEAGEAQEGAVSLDVHTCVQMALTQNAQVLVAQDDVDAAREKVGQAASAMKPKVTGKVTYAYIDGLNSYNPSGVLGAILGDMVSTLQGEKTQRTDSVSVEQTLFAGGQIIAATKASRFLAQSQEWKKQATLNDLELQAKQGYYACLLARAIKRVAEESVVTFKRHQADAQQMLDVGMISNFEVLRAKTEVGSREADLVAAKNAVRLAVVNLRRVLALPEDKPIRLTGKLEWTPNDTTVDDLVKKAIENRPEILALQKALDAADQNIKRVKGEYLPAAAASASWNSIDGNGEASPEGWTVGVGAQMDFYAGGKRKHEMGEAKAQKSGIEHQLEDVRRLIELDVRNAFIQMEDAAARIRQEQGTVELGREGRRLAQLRFQEGVGTQSETLDAELALTNSETMLVKAIHDYASAHASLEKAIGKSWIKSEETPAK
jgi:outer membrane protein TolC